ERACSGIPTRTTFPRTCASHRDRARSGRRWPVRSTRPRTTTRVPRRTTAKARRLDEKAVVGAGACDEAPLLGLGRLLRRLVRVPRATRDRADAAPDVGVHV